MTRKSIILKLIFIVTSFNLMSQSFSLKDVECINPGGGVFEFPFVGGMNSVQFNEIDLDLDGIMDLMIFDREGEIVSTFLFKNDKYVYAPEYRTIFPRFRKWVRLRDYNADGIMDVFCFNLETPLDGIEIWTGSIVDNSYLFTKSKETNGYFEIIYYLFQGNYFNLEVTGNDLPDIADVDGDGDLDIVSFTGDDPFVRWYRNTSQEDGVSLDQPHFVLEDLCWGKFKENGFNQQIFLSEDPDNCADNFKGNENDGNTKNNIHAGSTITVYDDDGDGDFEAIIGDLSNRNLIWLYNDGGPGSGHMTEQDTMFPMYDTPIDMPFFNAAFLVDVDHDGNDDLIASPNEAGGVENLNNIHLYLNSANNGEHDFQLVQKDFLQDKMYDFGSLTNPTVCDYNQDGKKDLLIGTFGQYFLGENPDSRLILLENKSEGNELKFEIVDSDYLGFNQYKEMYFSFAPTLGDIDNDGDDDLLVGTHTGKVLFKENIAGDGKAYEFGPTVFNYFDIDVGDNCKPQIIDLNKDGLADIILGERNQNPDPNDDEKQGNLNYYQNVGSEGDPQFLEEEKNMPNTPVLGHVVTRDNTTTSGSAAPFFYPVDEDFLLFVGSEPGKIKYYKDVVDNIYGDFTLVDESIESLYEGKRSTVVVDDLDEDGLLEFIVGNIRGGFAIYGSNLNVAGMVNNREVSIELSIYPNPAEYEIILAGEIGEVRNVELISPIGQSLPVNYQRKSAEEIIISIENIPNGIYFVRLETQQGFTIRRIVVLKR